MDDSHIVNKTNAEAYRLGIDYALNENMNLGVLYGYFEDKNKTLPNDVATNQTRNLLRINYIF